jgi:hypothetical protein
MRTFRKRMIEHRPSAKQLGNGPRCRLCLIALVITAFVLIGSMRVYAISYEYLKPEDPSLNWTFVIYDGGTSCPICKVIIDLAVRQKDSSPAYCGLPKQLVGVLQPVWKRADQQQHMDLVRAVLAIENTAWNPDVAKDLNLPSSASDTAIGVAFWSRYGHEIQPLLENGAFEFSQTDFDLDGDGNLDAVYRITNVEPVALRPGGDWKFSSCDPQGKFPAYDLFVEPAEAPAIYRLLRSRAFGAGMWPLRYQGDAFIWTMHDSAGTVEQIRRRSNRLHLQQVFSSGYD